MSGAWNSGWSGMSGNSGPAWTGSDWTGSEPASDQAEPWLPSGVKLPSSFTQAMNTAVNQVPSTAPKGGRIAAMLQKQRQQAAADLQGGSKEIGAQSSSANVEDGQNRQAAAAARYRAEKAAAATQVSSANSQDGQTMMQKMMAQQMTAMMQMAQVSQQAAASRDAEVQEELEEGHNNAAEDAEDSDGGSSNSSYKKRRRETSHQTSTFAEREQGVNGLDEENRFVGRIREFSKAKGFGFIDCMAAKAKYGRHDIWIHRGQMFSFKVGDEVSFLVTKNKQGQPQARHVILARDISRIKKKKAMEESKTELQLQAKRSSFNDSVEYTPAPRGVMSEEQAKQFQASLKRKA